MRSEVPEHCVVCNLASSMEIPKKDNWPTEIFILLTAPHNANTLLFLEAQLYYSYYILIDLLRLLHSNY